MNTLARTLALTTLSAGSLVSCGAPERAGSAQSALLSVSMNAICPSGTIEEKFRIRSSNYRCLAGNANDCATRRAYSQKSVENQISNDAKACVFSPASKYRDWPTESTSHGYTDGIFQAFTACCR